MYFIPASDGKVLDSRGCRFETPSVVSLSKTLYPLLSAGSTQEDLSGQN